MGQESKIDWSRFTVKQPLEGNKQSIMGFWMTQEGLEDWFLRIAEFTGPEGKLRDPDEHVQAGDTFRWTWYGWPDDMFETGEVLKPKEGEFFRFVFGKAGIVGVSLFGQDGHQVLKLDQEDIPVDDESRMEFHVGCKTGWTFYIVNLKSILHGGLDLRNKHNQLKMD